jgi:hypothetical protein
MAEKERELTAHPTASSEIAPSAESVRDYDTLAAQQTAIAPVAKAERISSIDTLRGFALLGILVMNITAFRLPEYAYIYPVVPAVRVVGTLSPGLLSIRCGKAKCGACFP